MKDYSQRFLSETVRLSKGCGASAGTLWTNLALPNGSAITNVFNGAGMLAGTYLKNSGGSILNKHVYTYNSAGQRSQQTRADSSYIDYTYDADGQLESGWTYTSGGSPITSETFGFNYDGGWNMTQRTNNAAATTYTVNDRNQVTGDGVNTFSYDTHGNRYHKIWYSPSTGSITYTYDDEQRLSSAYTDTYYTPSGSRWKVEFTYDGKSRLRIRKRYTWDSYQGDWSTSPSETRFIYDGMLMMQERNGANTPTVSYTRGLDLSGSLEGAGGIGGLLARSSSYSGGSWSTHLYYHADAGGNVTYLANDWQRLRMAPCSRQTVPESLPGVAGPPTRQTRDVRGLCTSPRRSSRRKRRG